MDLEQNIKTAEKRFLPVIEEFFIEKWGDAHLFSHDLNHHRRVWYYAKELLSCNEKDVIKHTQDFCNKLLIACYLHDVGMSVDPEVHHGIHSRKLCYAFLLNNNLNESDFADVLDAIEYHDDKEYKTQSTNSNDILKLLAVADDLDAFGYIGIYRYLEIYITRGIRPEVIGKEIRKNAIKRFKNFELNFGNYPDLIERHRKRFRILDDFFSGYNKEAGSL
jgi:HD superfamily phosphodiesterase